MLYFGDTSVEGGTVSDLVTDLTSIDEVQKFAKAENSSELVRVVTIFDAQQDTSVHMFPAMPAMAKHMKVPLPRPPLPWDLIAREGGTLRADSTRPNRCRTPAPPPGQPFCNRQSVSPNRFARQQ